MIDSSTLLSVVIFLPLLGAMLLFVIPGLGLGARVGPLVFASGLTCHICGVVSPLGSL